MPECWYNKKSDCYRRDRAVCHAGILHVDPERVYYRLTEIAIQASEELWSNPLFTLYPEISPSHIQKPA